MTEVSAVLCYFLYLHVCYYPDLLEIKYFIFFTFYKLIWFYGNINFVHKFNAKLSAKRCNNE